MVSIEISGPLALIIGLGGAIWIYIDGQRRNVETADMWAVGFFVGMFIPPIVGAVVVGILYFRRRDRGSGGVRPVRQ